jgi:hypothetical protein
MDMMSVLMPFAVIGESALPSSLYKFALGRCL